MLSKLGCVCVAGDIKAGDLGLGAVPGRELEFREGLDLTLKYAKALNCKRSENTLPENFCAFETLPIGSN